MNIILFSLLLNSNIQFVPLKIEDMTEKTFSFKIELVEKEYPILNDFSRNTF